ncbi:MULTISPECIES: RNA-binding protein hfq [Spirulina sp. CCY15215]|uniref:Hfq-related RNA-binding protein n=1 Tax=Spirulina sp. CCY15215 TaxID=2767591 RepID=UPI00194DB902|nr:RNA-binding protein hfq [Spirulina major]
MTEFDTGLPSIRQIQGFVRDKQNVEFKLITGDVLIGKVFWQDADCICIETESGQVTFWRKAMVYYKLKEG